MMCNKIILRFERVTRYPNLRPPYRRLLKPRMSELKRLQIAFYAKNFIGPTQVFAGLFLVISVQFTVDICVLPKIAKKPLKPAFCISRSFKVIIYVPFKSS